jgi:hypothetical protein
LLLVLVQNPGTGVTRHSLSKRNEDRQQTGQSCINCVRQSVYAFGACFFQRGRPGGAAGSSLL